MPAPNIATLLDFETALEDALVGYYTNMNIGGQVFTQILTPRTNYTTANFVQTPRLHIRCGSLGPMDTGSGNQTGTVTISNVDHQYYSSYRIATELEVVSQRNNASQIHGLLRGGVRQGLLELTTALNVNTLPYHNVAQVMPGACDQGIDAENDEIMTRMAYEIVLYVDPAAFP